MLRFASIFALLVPALAAPALASDTVFPGYAANGEHAVGVFDACATLPNLDRIRFDGSTIWREAEDGTFLQQLGSLQIPVFASFVVVDPTSTFALVGESSRGKIYRVDLGGGGMNVVTDLDFNFDARFEDAGHVLVSAAPCGFFCGNEIYRVALAGGATTLVASVSGPSGPIALAANGDLYYGVNTDVPGVPGSIIRWSASQLASGALLTEASATTIAPAIDPASSLEIEPVFGHLFAAQPVFGGTSHVVEFAPNGQFLGTVIASPDYLSGIQFLRTQAPGSFGAFQPPGVRLQYRATDYAGGTSALRRVRTKRARAFTSGPGLTGPGPVTVTIEDAHPNASVVMLMGATALYDPIETSYDLGYFLFHTGMPIDAIRRLGPVPTDANGHATFVFQNPGGLEGTRVFQALLRGANAMLVGSSTEAFN